jgi:hypothetical protein
VSQFRGWCGKVGARELSAYHSSRQQRCPLRHALAVELSLTILLVNLGTVNAVTHLRHRGREGRFHSVYHRDNMLSD